MFKTYLEDGEELVFKEREDMDYGDELHEVYLSAGGEC